MFIDCALWMLLGNEPQTLVKIAQREGFFKSGTLPELQNNPGALVYAGQEGAHRCRRGFAHFQSVAEGWRALKSDVSSKRNRGARLNRAWRYMK